MMNIDAKLEGHQICGSKQCPGCGHKLEGSTPMQDWVGLPAGVKFDPTDQELIEHLEAEVEGKSSKSHPLIDEFIPTIEGEDGICYTHPEKLPGLTKDGLSRHFFHRPSKAYTTGTRKRRKIQTECDLQGTGETRWHKTGKTRPVMVNGKQKGCKKILVLYTNFGKNRKPEKTNWVMHQYHVGLDEEEKDGELVVSKIFYQTQPRQSSFSTEPPSTHVKKETGNSSKKHHVITSRDRLCRDDQVSGAISTTASAIAVSGLTSMDMHQLKGSDHFSYVPFKKAFDEAGFGDASTMRDVNAMSMACDDHDQHHHHDHHALPNIRDQQHHHDDHHALPNIRDQQHHHHAMATFHISSRPSHAISQIIPPPSLHHHASIFLDHDSFHVSTIMLQNDTFQQEEREEEEHKRSELEEIIMGCTSSAPITQQETSITNNPQDAADWIKYSSFWHDPPDHHHG